MKQHTTYKDSGIEWIGEIPEHWETNKLKWIFYEKKKTTNPSLSSGAISFGEVIYKDDEKIPEATKANYQVLNKGEFLLNPLNLNYDLKSLRIALSKIDVVVSTGYIILKNRIQINKIFYKYLLHIYDIRYMKTLGSGVRQTISYNHISESLLPVPPLSEQAAIAEFLDEKTEKIDEAIRIKEREIELLKERRQILIQEVVTGKKVWHPDKQAWLPPTKTKDSGIEWIGEIPEEWEIIPNKYIFQLKQNLVGKKSKNYDLLSLTLKGIIKRDMENPEGKFPASFDKYQEVRKGEFVFCFFDVEETPRTVGLSTFDGMITGAYTVFEISRNFSNKFLYYFYLNLDLNKRLRFLYRGLRNTIPKESFYAFKTIIPPLSDQEIIAAFLDKMSNRIDKIIQIKEEEIEKLKEYKTVLIDAAVTGKVKVGENAFPSA